MKKTSAVVVISVLIILLIGFVFTLANFGSNNKNKQPINKIISNFKECEEAGNPIMESYPRKCTAEGQTFIEEVEINPVEKIITKMTEEQAKQTAQKSCVKGGETLEPGMYNEITKTWWFDANLNAEKSGCNPACVVSEETNTAEINWRCTGAIPTEERTQKIMDELSKLFTEKYPDYADSISIEISNETLEHIRGSVSFGNGEAGGIFLATRISGVWKIVHDGNGTIPCTLDQYGFPMEMLNDCSM